MLKLLEGSDVEVPVGATSKNAMVPLTTVNTRNILFICGGAFPELEKLLKTDLQNSRPLALKLNLKINMITTKIFSQKLLLRISENLV